MSNFEFAVGYVIENEGAKYEDDPRDPGGCTKFGVTLKSAQQDIFSHINNCEDIRNMTLEDAKKHYFRMYWRPFERITNPVVAAKLMDIYVNINPGSAMRMFQRAAGVKVDGLLGPKSIEAINTAPPAVYLESVIQQLTEYYKRIVEVHPERSVFLRGWLNRARRLPSE